MSESFRAGAAHRVISPPLGSQMAGFDARNGAAEVVHDDLHARVIVLQCGSTSLFLVSLEIIAVSRDLASRIRAGIAERCGVQPDSILVAATHTHCGPVTLNHFFNSGQTLDARYLQFLLDQTVAAAIAASTRLQPVALKAGMVPAPGIAVNRRSADGQPADQDAGVILVEREDGSPLAVLVLFACHPTVLGPNTLAISADFPYYTGEILRRELGGNTEVLFFNGAEGDISIGHRSDASAVGVIAPFRTFAKAEELGVKLGRAVALNLLLLKPQPPVLKIHPVAAALPLKSYPSATEMSRRRELAFQELQRSPESFAAKQEWLFARIEEYYAGLNMECTELQVEFFAIRLGEVALLSIPGEAFHAVGQKIRARSPFAVTLFLGLTNDYLGYIPDAGANASLGYEVVASRLAPEAANRLIDTAAALLRTLPPI